MDQKEFLREIENGIGLKENSFQEDVSLESLEGWDSMAILIFIAAVEEKFGLVLEGNQIASAKKVKDLLNLLGNNLN